MNCAVRTCPHRRPCPVQRHQLVDEHRGRPLPTPTLLGATPLRSRGSERRQGATMGPSLRGGRGCMAGAPVTQGAAAGTAGSVGNRCRATGEAQDDGLPDLRRHRQPPRHGDALPHMRR
jgi:hypothetical protein